MKAESKITAKQALRNTGMLWDWLAVHPAADKVDAYEACNIEPDPMLCPLCAHSNQLLISSEERCAACLLRHLWPEGCCEWTSPYAVWINSDRARTLTERYVAARQIADAAWEALAELQKGADKEP